MFLSEYAQNYHNKASFLSEVLAFCHGELLSSSSPTAESTRQYLLTRVNDLNHSQLTFGYFPPSEELSSLIKQFGANHLLAAGLIFPKYSSYLYRSTFHHHNLIFPYLNEYGYLMTLGGRKINEDLPEICKYYYASSNSFKFQKSLHIFGLSEAKKYICKNNKVVLVEGQFDCLSCWKHGILEAVALGGSHLTIYQLFSLLKYTNNFILLLDSDLGGLTGKKRILNRYSDLANWSSLILPPEYKDADIYLKEHLNFKDLIHEKL